MIILDIVYNFLTICFIFVILFWSEFNHTKIFRYVRKLVHYLYLDHSWAVFSIPWTDNKNLLLSIEYDNEKKELIRLLDCKTKIFFNRKLNTFDEKYAENMTFDMQARTNFIYYVKNKIENEEKKNIKKIEFIVEIEKIKLWDSNLNNNFAEKLVVSSYNF